MGRIQNIRNRSLITNTHIQELIQECLSNVRDLNFVVPANLRFLECKAKHRAGLACYSDSTIILSSFIYKENDDAIRTVIYHEIGHIIAGPGVHHGPGWQKIVNKIGSAVGLSITRCYKLDDMPVHKVEIKSQWKYNFRCKKCGCELHYTKRTEFVNTYNQIMASGKPRWTCRQCGSTFELVK